LNLSFKLPNASIHFVQLCSRSDLLSISLETANNEIKVRHLLITPFDRSAAAFVVDEATWIAIAQIYFLKALFNVLFSYPVMSDIGHGRDER